MEASVILGILTLLVLAFTIVKKQSQDLKLQKSDETLDDIYATD